MAASQSFGVLIPRRSFSSSPPAAWDFRAQIRHFRVFATLIFVERDAIFLQGKNMKLRMDKTLSFWVDCSYEDKKHETLNRTRAELIAEILRDYERHGDAMRYFNVKGQIAWKASPAMLHKLADAEREVEDDMADLL
jgi:hypothetical protein